MRCYLCITCFYSMDVNRQGQWGVCIHGHPSDTILFSTWKTIFILHVILNFERNGMYALLVVGNSKGRSD